MKPLTFSCLVFALNLYFTQKGGRENVAPNSKSSSKVAKRNRDRSICVLVLTENISKTELFDDGEVTKIMLFPVRVLNCCILNSSDVVWTEIFDVFSE